MVCRLSRRLLPALVANIVAMVFMIGLPATSALASFPYPLKGDADPHAGVLSAKRHAIQGIDVSKWQNEIDWTQVKKAGTRFAFIKATEGGDFLDENFRQNWDGARQAGVPRGAYHFLYWCRAAKDQVAWFIRNVPKDPEALPPILDVEWNNLSRCPRAAPAVARAKMREILVALHAHYGKKPVIYTDINFHEDVLEGTREFDDYPFWIRSTAAKPEERYSNRPWEFWQFTTTGRVPGITGDVDRNAFFGSEKDFTGWRQGRYDVGMRRWQDSSKPMMAVHLAPAEADKAAVAKAGTAASFAGQLARITPTRLARTVKRQIRRDFAATNAMQSRDRN